MYYITKGELIKELRSKIGMTQEQLSYGICTQPTLSRIEAGNQEPSRETLKALMERLGESGGELLGFSDIEELQQEKEWRRQFLYLQNEIYAPVEQYLRTAHNIPEEHLYERQTYRFIKGLYDRQQGIDPVAVLGELEEALAISVPGIPTQALHEHRLFCCQELHLFNAIATLHSALDQTEIAYEIFNRLILYLETPTMDWRIRYRIEPVVLNNFANLDLQLHDYESASRRIKEAFFMARSSSPLLFFLHALATMIKIYAKTKRWDNEKQAYQQLQVIGELSGNWHFLVPLEELLKKDTYLVTLLD